MTLQEAIEQILDGNPCTVTVPEGVTHENLTEETYNSLDSISPFFKMRYDQIKPLIDIVIAEANEESEGE